MKKLTISLALLVSLVSCSKNDMVAPQPIPVKYIVKFFSSDSKVGNVSVETAGSIQGRVKYMPAAFDCNTAGMVEVGLFAGTYKFNRISIVGQDTTVTPFNVVVPDYVNGCVFVDVK